MSEAKTSASYVSDVTITFDTEDQSLVPRIGDAIEIQVLGKTSVFRVEKLTVACRTTFDNEAGGDVMWYAGEAHCVRI